MWLKKLFSGLALLTVDNSKDGYKRVTLIKNNLKISKLVHRLVLLTFNPIDNMDELLVNHKDEDKSNNHLYNLEWCDCFYNVHYGTGIERMKRKQHKKKVKNKTTGVIYNSLSDASRQTCLPLSNLSTCCNGRLKTVGGFVWEFVD